METIELVTNMCKEKRRRRQWSHTTIICSGLFNSDSPRGNFLFFFFIFKCYCICFSNQGQQFLYPTFKGLGMFWSHSIRTSCKMFCSHLVSVNLNIMQKVSCTQVPLLLKKKTWCKIPVITSKIMQISLTFNLVFFGSPFNLVTSEIYNFECLNPFFSF